MKPSANLLNQAKAGVLGLFLGTAPVGAATLNLSSSPLFLGVSVDPNVFFMTDDSGSMDWSILTGGHYRFTNYLMDSNSYRSDGLWYGYSRLSSDCDQYGYASMYYMYEEPDNKYGGCREVEEQSQSVEFDWRILSSDFNYLYYDPRTSYEPWPGKSDADFSNARSNPQPGTDGYDDFRNLDGFSYATWTDDRGYSGTRPYGPDTATSTSNGEVDVWDSHVRYTLSGSSFTVQRYTYSPVASATCGTDDVSESPPFVSCLGTSVTTSTSLIDAQGRTVAQAKQNIANWYQYHRRRSFVSKNAIGTVVNNLPDFRYGLSLINDYGDVFVEMPASTVTDYTSHNTGMLNSFYDYEWQSQGTPLRRGLEVAGRYYTSSQSGSNNFGKTDPIINTCQQNFTVLFTDGYYNGSNPVDTDFTISDEDSDGVSDRLADVAMAYYENDLSDLANKVPTTPADLANWQHMVTFTVAFGVTGDLVDTDSDGWPDRYGDGTAMPDPLLPSSDWGDASSDPEKIDDMWHAAFNAKGEFISARKPSDVLDALESALRTISDRTSSASSVALSSGFLGSDTQVYQARFFSGDWSGELLAYPVLTGGLIASSPSWEAGTEISAMAPTSRVILTTNNTSGTGVPFRFPSDFTSPSSSEIDAGQTSDLLTYASALYTPAQTQDYGESVVNYLRGDRSQEGSGSTYGFRARSSVLGDIVHSDPIFVDEPKARYPSTWVDKRYPTATQPENSASESYNSFKTRLSSRAPMVWFGANDGMLHGLDARASGTTAGQELLAYVPGFMYENLPELTRDNYSHRYYVDGGTSVIDAYVSGSWRTVLAGSTAGGGQGIFTLDISDPSSFSESSAASTVMWEFSDADDADLGYTYSQPTIVRLHNGKWAAVFGNGYNNTAADGNASSDGDAVLFIVDLATGALIKKLDTGEGMAEDPTGAGRANGLAAVSPIDLDGDFIYDYVYAGDLFGNVWKFDLTSNDTSKWAIDGPGTTTNPIFTATDGESTPTAQPITSLIQVGYAPNGRSGVMLYFGTGKYLEVGDNSATGQATQTFYGIWDNFSADTTWTTAVTRSQLQEQKILEEVTQHGEELRVTSTTTVDWSTKKGWFMDLINQGESPMDNDGERVVSDPILRVDRIVFTTLLPSVDPCEFGGSGWLMVLDAFSGARLPETPFDLNGDGVFTTSDFATSSSGADVAVSGKKSKIGIIPTPGVISSGGGGPDYLVQSGSSGSTASDAFNPGPQSYGRQSWREIRD